MICLQTVEPLGLTYKPCKSIQKNNNRIRNFQQKHFNIAYEIRILSCSPPPRYPSGQHDLYEKWAKKPEIQPIKKNSLAESELPVDILSKCQLQNFPYDSITEGHYWMPFANSAVSMVSLFQIHTISALQSPLSPSIMSHGFSFKSWKPSALVMPSY